MHDSTAIALAMILYMGVCLLLGFVAYRRTTNLGDFILGGRSLGSYVTAFSAQATDMSGWLLMGLPGLAYASGFDSIWMLLGLVVGTYLNWKLVAARLREATERLGDSLTLPDYFEHRFADRSGLLRTASALFILVFFVFYTSSGFVAAGKLFESLFGLPYLQSMFWGSAVMLAYTFFGGFLAVSWSDVLQGTLMFVTLVVVAVLGVMLAGGPVDTIARLNALDAQLLDPFIGEAGQTIGWIGIASLAGWGLGYAGQPHILARFMAARSVAAIATARRVAMVWVVVVLVAAVVVGVTGLLVLPQPLAGADSEKVFITMATTFLPPALAGICLAGVMAAVMSTASAQLLVASSAFAQDIYRGLLRRDAGQAELLWTGRVAVLAIAALAFALARNPDSKVLDLVSWAWAGFGAAFGPAVILSLYWDRMTRAGAFAGILTGGLTVVLWQQLAGRGGLFGLYELVPGFVLSWFAIWSVSWLTQQTSAAVAPR
ncbi:MAG TPA: sodium/proline symporter PutP [Steroidobacteraceae bacterium]|nr:sodium/proline symporter PutP [Steroidobacteraceae bacterium]HRX89799.1 sodium/proline symporter PutP [Steroidobacteraceae bacterium]